MLLLAVLLSGCKSVRHKGRRGHAHLRGMDLLRGPPVLHLVCLMMAMMMAKLKAVKKSVVSVGLGALWGHCICAH